MYPVSKIAKDIKAYPNLISRIYPSTLIASPALFSLQPIGPGIQTSTSTRTPLVYLSGLAGTTVNFVGLPKIIPDAGQPIAAPSIAFLQNTGSVSGVFLSLNISHLNRHDLEVNLSKIENNQVKKTVTIQRSSGVNYSGIISGKSTPFSASNNLPFNIPSNIDWGATGNRSPWWPGGYVPFIAGSSKVNYYSSSTGLISGPINVSAVIEHQNPSELRLNLISPTGKMVRLYSPTTPTTPTTSGTVNIIGTQNLNYNGAPIPIPDNNLLGANAKIYTNLPGRVSGLKVSANILHQNQDDLRVSLISPTGEVILLKQNAKLPRQSGLISGFITDNTNIISIPDNNLLGASNNIRLNLPGNISGNINLSTTLIHPNINNVRLELISPSGKKVLIKDYIPQTATTGMVLSGYTLSPSRSMPGCYTPYTDGPICPNGISAIYDNHPGGRTGNALGWRYNYNIMSGEYFWKDTSDPLTWAIWCGQSGLFNLNHTISEDVRLTASILHPNRNDLRVELVSPQGKRIIVHDGTNKITTRRVFSGLKTLNTYYNNGAVDSISGLVITGFSSGASGVPLYGTGLKDNIYAIPDPSTLGPFAINAGGRVSSYVWVPGQISGNILVSTDIRHPNRNELRVVLQAPRRGERPGKEVTVWEYKGPKLLSGITLTNPVITWTTINDAITNNVAGPTAIKTLSTARNGIVAGNVFISGIIGHLNHPGLEVKLWSPKGKSVIVKPRNQGPAAGFANYDYRFITGISGFQGESIAGNWNLTVNDYIVGNNIGYIKDFALTISGDLGIPSGGADVKLSKYPVSGFEGTEINGIWELFAYDLVAGNTGSISRLGFDMEFSGDILDIRTDSAEPNLTYVDYPVTGLRGDNAFGWWGIRVFDLYASGFQTNRAPGTISNFKLLFPTGMVLAGVLPTGQQNIAYSNYPITGFRGEIISGLWRLAACDLSPGHVGFLSGFRMQFSGNIAERTRATGVPNFVLNNYEASLDDLEDNVGLAKLRGSQVSGEWRLQAQDMYSQYTGSINSFSLEVSGDIISTVTERTPTSIVVRNASSPSIFIETRPVVKLTYTGHTDIYDGCVGDCIKTYTLPRQIPDGFLSAPDRIYGFGPRYGGCAQSTNVNGTITNTSRPTTYSRFGYGGYSGENGTTVVSTRTVSNMSIPGPCNNFFPIARLNLPNRGGGAGCCNNGNKCTPFGYINSAVTLDLNITHQNFNDLRIYFRKYSPPQQSGTASPHGCGMTYTASAPFYNIESVIELITGLGTTYNIGVGGSYYGQVGTTPGTDGLRQINVASEPCEACWPYTEPRGIWYSGEYGATGEPTVLQRTLNYPGRISGDIESTFVIRNPHIVVIDMIDPTGKRVRIHDRKSAQFYSGLPQASGPNPTIRANGSWPRSEEYVSFEKYKFSGFHGSRISGVWTMLLYNTSGPHTIPGYTQTFPGISASVFSYDLADLRNQGRPIPNNLVYPPGSQSLVVGNFQTSDVGWRMRFSGDIGPNRNAVVSGTRDIKIVFPTQFSGVRDDGEWQLNIEDGYGGNTGILNSFSVTYGGDGFWSGVLPLQGLVLDKVPVNFEGEDPNGSWVLLAEDLAPLNTGFIKSFSINGNSIENIFVRPTGFNDLILSNFRVTGFEGESVNGNWRLDVVDLVSGFAGMINSASLRVSGNFVTGVSGGVTVYSPVITSLSNATSIVNQPFSYQITATNNPTYYSAAGLPAGLNINTINGLISGRISTVGQTISTISAINSAGTGSMSLNINTINSLNAPVITSAQNLYGTQGLLLIYYIVATNSPTSYNAVGLPAGLSIDRFTGRISGTPTTNGNTSVQISATNAAGTTQITLNISINSAPRPSIFSSLTATVGVNSPFIYQIAATQNPTSYNAVGLPAGLTVNTSTGLISGTIPVAGVYSVTISATTSAGGTSAETLSIIVTQVSTAVTEIGNDGITYRKQVISNWIPSSSIPNTAVYTDIVSVPNSSFQPWPNTYTIPQYISKVDYGAFMGAPNLKKIVVNQQMPSSIGDAGNPFWNCTALETIEMVNSANSQGYSTRTIWGNGASAGVLYGIPKQTSIPSQVVAPTRLITVPQQYGGANSTFALKVRFVIPNTVGANIANYAFYNNKTISNIEVDFYSPAFTQNHFSTMNKLESFHIGNHYLYDRNKAGTYMSTIDGVLYENGKNSWDPKKLICYPLGKTETTFNSQTSYIGADAFGANNKLTLITLPKDGPAPSVGAFNSCSALTGIHLYPLGGTDPNLANVKGRYMRIVNGRTLYELDYWGNNIRVIWSR